MHFRPKHEPDWEVVDHKEIDLVPTLYEDDEVDVQYVFSTDITRTFLFDAPSSSKPSPPPSPASQPSSLLAPPSPKASSCPISSPKRRFSRLSTTSSGSPHFRFRFSRSGSSSSSSSCTSSDASDDEVQAPSPRTSIFRSKSKSPARKSSPAPEASSGFTLSQTRDALRYARAQLLATDQVTKLGANVLLFEGWAVTHLRKGSQHRLQIRYSGRPARVSFASPPSSPAIPPFMELLPSL